MTDLMETLEWLSALSFATIVLITGGAAIILALYWATLRIAPKPVKSTTASLVTVAQEPRVLVPLIGVIIVFAAVSVGNIYWLGVVVAGLVLAYLVIDENRELEADTQ